MLSRAVSHPRHARSRQRRAVLASGLAAIAALAIGAAAVLALAAPDAGARSARELGVHRVAHVAHVSSLAFAGSLLGSALGDTALEPPTSYYEPPALSDPANPGIIVSSGPDEPDPFVFVQADQYFLFTSRDNVPQNLPVRSATVFGQWGPPSDALPDPPAWATPYIMWAPDVAQFGNTYMLYFTSQVQGDPLGRKCIGDAISTDPAGPFISSPTPLICQLPIGGSIDPRVFVDSNGQPYMIWKSDENAMPNGGPTQIWSQPLSADGMHLVGSATAIFGPDEAWQHTIVEAPQIVLVKGVYYLFYSGGWFNQSAYAIGVARCAGPNGPCHDTSAKPLLASNAQGAGPGEESVFTNSVGFWMLYSPWYFSLPNPHRPVAMAHLGFDASGPYLAAPLSTTSSTSTGSTREKTPAP